MVMLFHGHTLKTTANFDFIQLALFNGGRRIPVIKISGVALLLSIIFGGYTIYFDRTRPRPLSGKTIHLCVAGPKEPGIYTWVGGLLSYRGALVIPDCTSPTVGVTVSIVMDKRGTEWRAGIVARDQTATITDLENYGPNNPFIVKRFTEKIADRIAKMM
jgi:hypothetical protein